MLAKLITVSVVATIEKKTKNISYHVVFENKTCDNVTSEFVLDRPFYHSLRKFSCRNILKTPISINSQHFVR